VPNEDGTAALWRVIPETSPQDEATSQLVERLRDDVLPQAVGDSGLDPLVSGSVAILADFSTYLSARLPLFFAAVLALSFLLLMAVFRSILVPLKAVLMNLLSIGAAYGVVVAGFQWGWLGGILGFEGAPVEPFLPMMMFAIVFGLSMDYEVFLLSRVREEWLRTGDSHESVANGLAATARVITAAALIMVFVFGGFLLEDDRIVKLMGTGLATAVFLDATVVRMLLVPATMELLGDRNWWLPRWLDRLLPNIDVEGHAEDDTSDPDGPGAAGEPERELTRV
jgi:RND superfamily putative drug exporter